MTDLTWRPHWSTIQGFNLSGRRHQTLDTTKFDLSSDRARVRDTTYNLGDSNNNYEEVIQDVSYKVVEKKAQMDHVEDAP